MILAMVTVSGLTFPIEEANPIAEMKTHAEKALDLHRAHAEALQEYVQHPTPVENVQKASVDRAYFYDPSFIHEGQTYNPLDALDIPGGLLLFDGTDPKQVAWAKTFPKADFYWILVKGSPIELSRLEDREVYFDQWGLFTERFGVKNVPAKIVQRENRLLVEEMAL